MVDRRTLAQSSVRPPPKTQNLRQRRRRGGGMAAAVWGLLRNGSIETFAARFPVNRFICPIHWRPMCGLVTPSSHVRRKNAELVAHFTILSIATIFETFQGSIPQSRLILFNAVDLKICVLHCTRSTTDTSLSKMMAGRRKPCFLPDYIIYAGCRFWFSIYLQAAWTNKM